tara:strand:- start:16 stop:240 length:225 start_codon:yes stop_codon:yes gene_type:complete
MTKLINNETTSITAGDYVVKATGALNVQYQMDDEGFTTIAGASFTTAGEGLITLPICIVKCANAGSNILRIKKV